MGPARIYRWRKMRRSRAPSIAPGIFFVAQSWADCITNMPGFNFTTGTGVLTPSPSAVSAPAREQVSSELLETTKGLEVTQQQAVDQLQVGQDQLVAQQTETRQLSEQIATLTAKLDALQQSVANIPAPSVAAPLPTPKAPPSKK